MDDEGAAMAAEITSPSVAELLRQGHAVFGIFSGDHTPEQGAAMAANRDPDFIFYSLESGPFDIPAMEAYMAAMTEASGDAEPRPIALRVPPIRDGAEEAAARIREGLAGGAESIVFPHAESAEDVQVAVEAMGADLWPVSPNGSLANMFIVEDQAGIAGVRDVVSAPGVSVVIAGPGDLRRAYDGDMEQVEAAIQTVLATCLEFDIPCGITAGVADIGERLEQGFRLIIVTEPEAIPVGKAAAGR
jgi:4-hydroxy-2-oxoheptanedioate aldolase